MDPHRGEVITLRTGITSDESDPSSGTDGFVTPPQDVTHLYVFVSGGTSCTLNAWAYDGSAWSEGADISITGSQTAKVECRGDRMELKITSVTGTYAIRYQTATTGS